MHVRLYVSEVFATAVIQTEVKGMVHKRKYVLEKEKEKGVGGGKSR